MSDILTKFKEFCKTEWPKQSVVARGLGLRRSHQNITLDVWYPLQCLKGQDEIFAILSFVQNAPEEVTLRVLDVAQISCAIQILLSLAKVQKLTEPCELALGLLQKAHADFEKPRQTYAHTEVVDFVSQDLQQPVTSAEEAYFKLHLLSHRLMQPQSLNVNGIFGVLQNVAWTNWGPVLPQDIETMRLQAHFTDKPLAVSHVDKFPYMLDYCVPTGVRIANASRVRLGAHLSEGTTVMPAGYVNFNAGTLGQSMIEGRVSAGVTVGSGTDIGGGASIMGTLSGGGKEVITLGQNCLLGANSGVGISLGNGCTIAAGVYVTASAKVCLYNDKNVPIDLHGKEVSEGKNIVKARELSGRDFLLFLQDSQTGKLICKPNQKQIELNVALHQNS